MLSRGLLKFLVAFVLAMLSLIPVVGYLFAALAIVWVIWGSLLIILGVVDYVGAIKSQDADSPDKPLSTIAQE